MGILEEVILSARTMGADRSVKEKRLYLSANKFDELEDAMRYKVERFCDAKLADSGVTHVLIHGIPVIREESV